MKRSCFLGILLMTSLAAMSQVQTVKGKVTLFNTYPLNNIPVEAKKAKTTVHTDTLGRFTIECKDKDQILIQSKGYLTASKKVGPDAGQLDFNLVFKDTPKNREYVVSQGHIDRNDLEYGRQNLAEENNDYCSYSDFFSLVKSKFPEVDVRASPSGGEGVYLRRGTKSMSQDTQMLYVVDGVRRRIISDINPCEIARIKVLSEGQAAKYGAGSSNGALEITLKSR